MEGQISEIYGSSEILFFSDGYKTLFAIAMLIIASFIVLAVKSE